MIADSKPLVISTQTWRSRMAFWSAVLTIVFLGAFTLFLPLLGELLSKAESTAALESTGSPSWVSVFFSGFMCVAGLILIGFAFVVARRRIRGKWEFGPEGVVFTRPGGQEMRLQWEQIQRILWTRSLIRLSDGATEVSLTSIGLDDRTFNAAREWIRGATKESFDLEVRRVARSKGWYARFIAVHCPLGLALMLVTNAMLDFLWKAPFLTAALAFFSLGVAWFLMMILLSLDGVRHQRQFREINPLWRERRDSQG